MNQVENFQFEAKCFLKEAKNDVDKLNDLLEHGLSFDIELPELNLIKQVSLTFIIPLLRVS